MAVTVPGKGPLPGRIDNDIAVVRGRGDVASGGHVRGGWGRPRIQLTRQSTTGRGLEPLCPVPDRPSARGSTAAPATKTLIDPKEFPIAVNLIVRTVILPELRQLCNN